MSARYSVLDSSVMSANCRLRWLLRGSLVLVLLLAASVKDGPAPLRLGCSPDARVLASLPSGTPVALSYSISGESGPCYKVSVEVDGKILEGSLPGSAIDHTEDFDRARTQAVWMDTPLIVNAIRESAVLPSMGASAGVTAQTVAVAQKAFDLIDSSQPQKALELLQPE